MKFLLLVCREMDVGRRSQCVAGFQSLMSLRQECGPQSSTWQGNIIIVGLRVKAVRAYFNLSFTRLTQNILSSLVSLSER